jgi:armadillo repeat-containing protein 8
MRYREGILKALAALAPFKDEYRKAICDNGVVPYIIDSLKPRPSEQPEDLSKSKNTVADGNPIPTLLAACGAARTLTRSVTALRTSLIDAGVTLPLVELIKHRDIEVQIAATSVICNLVLDFSPMREVRTYFFECLHFRLSLPTHSSFLFTLLSSLTWHIRSETRFLFRLLMCD